MTEALSRWIVARLTPETTHVTADAVERAGGRIVDKAGSRVLLVEVGESAIEDLRRCLPEALIIPERHI